ILHRQLGDLDESETVARALLELRRQVQGPRGGSTGDAAWILAQTLVAGERWEEAALLFEEALAIGRAGWGGDRPKVARVLHEAGDCLRSLERFEEAEAALRESYELYFEALGPEHSRTVGSAKCLAKVYDAWGNTEQAAAWRARVGDGPSGP
ncbi:MAG: tetratricopeptide repeat protein, partial [Planctomycetota bacterium]